MSVPRLSVHGTIRVPGDKSISHRALIFAALADGRSRIRAILRSADVHSSAGVMRALGVDVPPLAAEIAVRGRGRRGLAAPGVDLDCGNSGTAARLIAGVVAGHPFSARFVGDESLSRRPMRRIARPLSAMGARVELAEHGGLPMIVHGAELHAVDWTSDVASAQVKSAVLIAALVAGTPATVHEPARSRDHTERMLAALGASVAVRDTTVAIAPVERLAPLDITVPADPSSAAFLAALATLASAGELALPEVCLNPTRTGFFAALGRMGARLTMEGVGEEGGEAVGTVWARPASLRGISLGADDVPSMIDEIPLLACVAARAEGTTEITGAAELRVKESDRIATAVGNLRALGADAEERPDGLVVRGNDAPLRGRVRTYGDHRIAMAFGVLAALPGNAIEIDDPDCAIVSYPGFWDDLRRATGGGAPAALAGRAPA